MITGPFNSNMQVDLLHMCKEIHVCVYTHKHVCRGSHTHTPFSAEQKIKSYK